MAEGAERRLLELARAVADGTPIDWPSLASDDVLTPRIEGLRILASIADACGMPAEAPRDVGTLFSWGPLEIREKVGEGAFGEVFRAWDSRLEREVAVKFLRQDAIWAARHVLREGRNLARIRHPGVVTVHGAEQLDGRAGIWMEYVRGRTLEDLLQERGPFPAEEAIRIGIDLCRALAAVHRAGLVHRDVKTRNVVREESGRIVLMDLGAGGVARADDVESSMVAGTPIYQAPEVLAGRAASPRSDLYSLGVLLFRLVTREYPISGTSLESLRSAHERGVRIALRPLRRDLSPSFARAVERALATDPARRFANAEDMEAALMAALEAPRRAARRRLQAVALLAVAAVAGGSFLAARRGREGRATLVTSRPPIVVADVDNRTGDPELSALAGMLITALEQSQALTVLTRPRMADILGRGAMRRDEGIDAALGLEIARRARASALLVATIRASGGEYRLGLVVIDPARRSRLFTTEERAADKGQVTVAIDALALRARRHLERDPKILVGLRPVARITTDNLAAYLHYDQAERLIDRLALPDARAELEKAIALDSTFGLAHSRLAYVCWWLNDVPCERGELERAFSLIDRVPDRQRYLLSAQGAMAHREGLEASRSILLEMERFYPDDKEMLYDIGDYSSHLSQYPMAIEYLEKVVAMDPGFARALQHLTRVYRDMGRKDRYLEWARRYAAADSTWDRDQLLGDALILNGDLLGGMRMLARGRDHTPERANDFRYSIANAWFHAGRPAEALREWDRALATAPSPSARSVDLKGRAIGRIQQGAYREAMADLDRAATVARAGGDAIDEAMADIEAAGLCMVGLNDRHAAFRHIEGLAWAESVITYRDTYFHYWPYWGGLFKLHLLAGDLAAAEALAQRKFTADKWYGPYVESYLHAGRGECAQAAAAASRVLEWGPAAENIPLLYFLARCQLAHGEVEEALESLQRIPPLCTHLTLGSPYYAKSLLLLAEACERNGDRGGAARAYARLLEQWREGDRDLPDRIAARRGLERVRTARLTRAASGPESARPDGRQPRT